MSLIIMSVLLMYLTLTCFRAAFDREGGAQEGGNQVERGQF